MSHAGTQGGRPRRAARHARRGFARLGFAGLAACLLAPPAGAATLAVEDEDGVVVMSLQIPAGDAWCLVWNHSVTGGRVADCFVTRAGQMVLDRSYLHDYAAGLGEVPGRGQVRPAAGGGYWIEGIDEPIPGNRLPLRVGRASTDHRLQVDGTDHDLSARAAGRRVTLHLIP